MAKRTTVKKEENPMLRAVRFAALASKDDGKNISESHSRIVNGYVIGFDGIVAAGHPIDTDLPHVCPHTAQLVKSLERVSAQHSITITNNMIHIRGDKFKSHVQCVPVEDMPYIAPDARAYPMNNAFATAAAEAMVFTKEGADKIVMASILTGDGTLKGTNGNAFVEVYHGIPTPPGLIIPVSFVKILAKITDKEIAGFGFSEQSLTIHYSDGAWVRTQLYSEGWPKIDGILVEFTQASQYDIPKGFFEAIETVMPFAAKKEHRARFIYTDYNEIRSHPKEYELGAVVEVKGIPSAVHSAFFGPDLLVTKNYVSKIDQTHQKYLYLFSEKSRYILIRAD